MPRCTSRRTIAPPRKPPPPVTSASIRKASLLFWLFWSASILRRFDWFGLDRVAPRKRNQRKRRRIDALPMNILLKRSSNGLIGYDNPLPQSGYGPRLLFLAAGVTRFG